MFTLGSTISPPNEVAVLSTLLESLQGRLSGYPTSDMEDEEWLAGGGAGEGAAPAVRAAVSARLREKLAAVDAFNSMSRELHLASPPAPPPPGGARGGKGQGAGTRSPSDGWKWSKDEL
mmetsp:Transcript_58175/g.185216  ORF Transcript_58175/g.185216 Transcript_58175/m.185216 type:complete len:119 (+) Transcript_58175:166-522(+)